MKTIKITFDGKGAPTVEAVGFVGGSCKEATKGILMALSGPGAEMITEDKAELHMMEEEEVSELESF